MILSISIQTFEKSTKGLNPRKNRSANGDPLCGVPIVVSKAIKLAILSGFAGDRIKRLSRPPMLLAII